MQKMIYICPVDWLWLKQRPQFLAEELGRSYDVHILYPWKNNRKGLQKGNAIKRNLRPYFSIPSLGGKIPGVQRMNRFLHKLQFRVYFYTVRPELIWVTHPDQLAMLPSRFAGLVIYDCMDDYEAIEMNQSRRGEISKQESDLVRRADVIFTSSQAIRLRLLQNYQANPNKVFLVRNGYDAKWKAAAQTQPAPEKKLRIGYFGTIGRWFDFNLLQTSLEQIPEIEYHLFGALEKDVTIPQCDRLVYHGVMEHSLLPQLADEIDVFVMPFQLTQVVESVDPVKLYEYIFMRKPIVCVRYEEVEWFEPFVLFYQTQEMYIDHLKRLLAGNVPLYSDEQAQDFLDGNSWFCRGKQVCQALADYAEANE